MIRKAERVAMNIYRKAHFGLILLLIALLSFACATTKEAKPSLEDTLDEPTAPVEEPVAAEVEEKAVEKEKTPEEKAIEEAEKKDVYPFEASDLCKPDLEAGTTIAAHHPLDAERYFKVALQKDPRCYHALNNLGLLALHAGKYAEAKSRFDEASRIEPRYPQAIINRAAVDVAQGDYGRAAEYLKSQSQRLEDSNDVDGYLAYTLVLDGRLDEAISTARNALKRDEQNTMCLLAMGWAFLKQDKHELASMVFTQVSEIDTTVAEAYYGMGLVALREKRMSDARDQFLKAIEKRPDFAEAHLNLGNFYLDDQDFAQAEKHFKEALGF